MLIRETDPAPDKAAKTGRVAKAAGETSAGHISAPVPRIARIFPIFRLPSISLYVDWIPAAMVAAAADWARCPAGWRRGMPGVTSNLYLALESYSKKEKEQEEVGMKKTMAFAAIAAAGFASAAMAQTFGSGFEAPTYTAGENLSGQNGWMQTSGAATAFQITDTFARTGNQSLLMQHPAPGDFSSIHVGFRTFTPDAGNHLFEMSSWVYIDSAGTPSNARFFGIQMASSAFEDGNLAGVAIESNGNIRARTGGGLWSAAAIVESGRRDDIVDRWIKLSVWADLSTTTDNVMLTISNLGTSAGSDTVSVMRSANFANFINLAIVNSYSTTPGGPALAYMDDFHAIAYIPAPGALALLGLAGLVGVRRRRN